MAKHIEREKVIQLRLQGASYSQIKKQVNVSKGTLSKWLEKLPLSQDRIRELRDWNPQRIEKSRNTKALKRKIKLDKVYKQESNKIGKLNNRDVFLSGLFLYWGEGTKSLRGVVAISNTDPSMIRFFIKWLHLVGVPQSKFKIRLQLYSDMDISKGIAFWSDELNLPKHLFKKPYIKSSKLSELSYKSTFGHGTCMVHVNDINLHDKVIAGIQYLKNTANKA